MTPGLSHRFEALKVMADGVALDPRDDAVTVVNNVMSAGVSGLAWSAFRLTRSDPSHGRGYHLG